MGSKNSSHVIKIKGGKSNSTGLDFSFNNTINRTETTVSGQEELETKLNIDSKFMGILTRFPLVNKDQLEDINWNTNTNSYMSENKTKVHFNLQNSLMEQFKPNESAKLMAFVVIKIQDTKKVTCGNMLKEIVRVPSLVQTNVTKDKCIEVDLNDQENI